MKKVWGASELARFFVTGPTDASGIRVTFIAVSAGRMCRC